jgi:hypothetical protein
MLISTTLLKSTAHLSIMPLSDDGDPNVNSHNELPPDQPGDSSLTVGGIISDFKDEDTKNVWN